MRVPNLENAIVAEAKITQYLLSETHEHGKHKAKFFLSLGFSVAQWEVMRDALFRHLWDNDVSNIVAKEHSVNYVVEGTMTTPSGKTPLVRSIWAIDATGIPFFASAYKIDKILRKLP